MEIPSVALITVPAYHVTIVMRLRFVPFVALCAFELRSVFDVALIMTDERFGGTEEFSAVACDSRQTIVLSFRVESKETHLGIFGIADLAAKPGNFNKLTMNCVRIFLVLLEIV